MIPIAMPLLKKVEAAAACKAVLSGWVSQGPQVSAFEREFAASVGSSHACAVPNCTTALHLALLAVDVGVGDEVITASHSFIATANGIRYCGATPVFVDIDPRAYNIDPQQIAEAVTGRTRAILAIHQMGMPCDLPALTAVTSRHNIALIEDAPCRTGFIDVDGYVELALETYAGARNLPEWRARAQRRWVGAYTGAVRSDLRRRGLGVPAATRVSRSSLHQNRRVNPIANSNLSCCP